MNPTYNIFIIYNIQISVVTYKQHELKDPPEEPTEEWIPSSKGEETKTIPKKTSKAPENSSDSKGSKAEEAPDSNGGELPSPIVTSSTS